MLVGLRCAKPFFLAGAIAGRSCVRDVTGSPRVCGVRHTDVCGIRSDLAFRCGRNRTLGAQQPSRISERRCFFQK